MEGVKVGYFSCSGGQATFGSVHRGFLLMNSYCLISILFQQKHQYPVPAKANVKLTDFQKYVNVKK
jgi:hypothetical protein